MEARRERCLGHRYKFPARMDVVLEASRKPGAGAAAYEQCKRSYLNTAADCLQQGFSFIPIVGEPSGGWGPSAQCVLKAFARLIAAQSGQDVARELQDHRRPIGVFLRRANARAIFAREPAPTFMGRCPVSIANSALESLS